MTCQTDDTVSLQPDVTGQPQHGTLSTRREAAVFQSSIGNSACNGKTYMPVVLYYSARKGYRGKDQITIRTTRRFGRMESEVIYVIDIDVR